MTDISIRPEFSRPLSLRRLPRAQSHSFEHVASDVEQTALARVFDAREVPRMRMEGTIAPLGEDGWTLQARLRATVIQTCVVTLEPVTSRVDAVVKREFVPGREDRIDELDPDEIAEPLRDEIDLGLIAMEELALALPPYPRNPTADISRYAPDDAELDDERPNPFAALVGLRDKMDKDA